MRQFVLILGLLFAPWFAAGVAAAEGGQMITLKSAMGTELQGYAAGPEDAGKAILLLHDRWGFNDTMRQWADRFAAKGFRVLAIDVFDGRASDKMALATEIMASVDPEWIKQDVLAGLKYLAGPRRAIVTIGAGLGGWQSFQAALLAPDQVTATVVMYGEMEVTSKDVGNIRAPILAFFAKNDPKITPAVVAGYLAVLRKPQSPHRFTTVEAGHGFMDPHYPEYNQAQAEEVWGQIERFLTANIGDI